MSTQEPREIAFEDIKKGDDIEARYAEDGVTYTRRGIAHRLSPGFWYTEARGLIANGYDGDWKFYLHSRPAPAEPKGLGVVVRTGVTEGIAGAHIVRTLVRTATRFSPWVDGRGSRWDWSDLDPESIEVLSEGIEVES